MLWIWHDDEGSYTDGLGSLMNLNIGCQSNLYCQKSVHGAESEYNSFLQFGAEFITFMLEISATFCKVNLLFAAFHLALIIL